LPTSLAVGFSGPLTSQAVGLLARQPNSRAAQGSNGLASSCQPFSHVRFPTPCVSRQLSCGLPTRGSDGPVITVATSSVAAPAGTSGGGTFACSIAASGQNPQTTHPKRMASQKSPTGLPSLPALPNVWRASFEVCAENPIIGTGSFAQVFQVLHRTSRQHFAVKVMHRPHFSIRGIEAQIDAEIRSMQLLSGDVPGLDAERHVVRLHDVTEELDNVFLLLELCHRGDVRRLLREKACGRLAEADAALWARQLFLGLSNIHRLGVLHRDIKPENLLCTHDSLLKITDFGWCAELKDAPNTLAGTFHYMAPEVLRLQPQTAAADVWSAGAVIFQMLTGRQLLNTFLGAGATRISHQNPQESTNIRRKRLLEEIATACPPSPSLRPQDVSPSCWKALRRMLAPDVDKRMTVDEALRHDWLQQDHSSSAEEDLAGEPGCDVAAESLDCTGAGGNTWGASASASTSAPSAASASTTAPSLGASGNANSSSASVAAIVGGSVTASPSAESAAPLCEFRELRQVPPAPRSTSVKTVSARGVAYRHADTSCSPSPQRISPRRDTTATAAPRMRQMSPRLAPRTAAVPVTTNQSEAFGASILVGEGQRPRGHDPLHEVLQSTSMSPLRQAQMSPALQPSAPPLTQTQPAQRLARGPSSPRPLGVSMHIPPLSSMAQQNEHSAASLTKPLPHNALQSPRSSQERGVLATSAVSSTSGESGPGGLASSPLRLRSPQRMAGHCGSGGLLWLPKGVSSTIDSGANSSPSYPSCSQQGTNFVCTKSVGAVRPRAVGTPGYAVVRSRPSAGASAGVVSAAVAESIPRSPGHPPLIASTAPQSPHRQPHKCQTPLVPLRAGGTGGAERSPQRASRCGSGTAGVAGSGVTLSAVPVASYRLEGSVRMEGRSSSVALPTMLKALPLASPLSAAAFRDLRTHSPGSSAVELISDGRAARATGGSKTRRRASAPVQALLGSDPPTTIVATSPARRAHGPCVTASDLRQLPPSALPGQTFSGNLVSGASLTLRRGASWDGDVAAADLIRCHSAVGFL